MQGEYSFNVTTLKQKLDLEKTSKIFLEHVKKDT